jgi:hypothetical protein
MERPPETSFRDPLSFKRSFLTRAFCWQSAAGTVRQFTHVDSCPLSLTLAPAIHYLFLIRCVIAVPVLVAAAESVHRMSETAITKVSPIRASALQLTNECGDRNQSTFVVSCFQEQLVPLYDHLTNLLCEASRCILIHHSEL